MLNPKWLKCWILYSTSFSLKSEQNNGPPGSPSSRFLGQLWRKRGISVFQINCRDVGYWKRNWTVILCNGRKAMGWVVTENSLPETTRGERRYEDMDWPATNFSLRSIFEEKTWVVRGMNIFPRNTKELLLPYHPKSLTRGAMDFVMCA